MFVVCNCAHCLFFAQAKKQRVDNNPTLKNMLHNEVSTMTEDYATKRKAWCTEVKQLKNANTELEQEIDQTEKLLDNAKNSISQLEANLATANSIIAQLQSELAAAKMATPQLKADLATVNTTISNLQADLTTANSSIAQLTKSNSNLASDLKKEKEENYHFRWHWQDGVNKDFSNFVYRNSRAKGDKTPGFHIAEYLEVVG